MRFSGKVALITGSNSGIGRATALAMAKEGAEGIVVHYSKNENGAKETAEEIRKLGVTALIVKADLRTGSEAKKLVDATIGEFGKIDILVNNAGMFDGFVPFCDQTEELWDHAFDLNVKGAFMCCKYAVPHMLEKKKGVIINIASAAGVEGGGGGAAYTCSKHAVIGLTMQITAELGRKGIRANTVCPGLIRTGMVEDLLNSPEFMDSINGTPAGRVGEVEDTTKLILFLASDDSSYMHGDTILIDGGLIVG